MYLDGEIESGGIHWLDGRRLLSPWEAQEHVQVDGESLRATGCVCQARPETLSLCRITASLLGEAGSSRQPDPRDCNF